MEIVDLPFDFQVGRAFPVRLAMVQANAKRQDFGWELCLQSEDRRWTATVDHDGTTAAYDDHGALVLHRREVGATRAPALS